MKCHALLTCDKLIIDKDGAHSLINVILHAHVGEQQLQTDTGEWVSIPIPPKAVNPNQWWIYTLWEPSHEDVGGSFEQIYQLYWPNGEKVSESRLSFKQKDEAMQQTSYFYLGFPIGQEGKVRILTWIESKGERTSDIAETHVLITHSKSVPPTHAARSLISG
jgi:hypothetical protein